MIYVALLAECVLIIAVEFEIGVGSIVPVLRFLTVVGAVAMSAD